MQKKGTWDITGLRFFCSRCRFRASKPPVTKSRRFRRRTTPV